MISLCARMVRCLSTRRLFSSGIDAERQIKQVLQRVIDPVVTSRSIVSTGLVQGITIDKDQHRITLDLELFVPGHPHAAQISESCKKELLQQLSWVKFVDVNVLKRQRRTVDALQSSSLVNVGHILAVSSCKGGVGKSTVAVNLACELQRRGLRVGLLDADIYGPSLPLMVQPIDHAVKKSLHNSKWIQPLECTNGLKVMSFGYVNPRSGAPGAGGKGPAVMRGPIATRVINQLVGATEWGDLDYLLVDMPPGTGDIQITLSQAMSFTGAIIVTTPHELSLADATKGVAMFEVLKVPTLAVVENMSFFECEHGTRYYPFGRGGREGLLQALNHATSYESEMNQSSDSGCGSSSSSGSNSTKLSSNTNNAGVGELYERLKVCPLHCLPLSSDVSGYSDVSNDNVDSSLTDENTPSKSNQRVENNQKLRVPAVMRLPNGSPISKIYASLADDVIIEIVKMQLNAQTIPSMTYIEGRGIIMRYYTASQAIQHVIPAIELRIRDPQTGQLFPDHHTRRKNSIIQSASPVHFDFKGNYGVAINWSDGHYADIFPFEVLKIIAEELSSATTMTTF